MAPNCSSRSDGSEHEGGVGQGRLRTFHYEALPWNVVFGTGALREVRSHVSTLGFRRALVLSTPDQAADAARVVALLGDIAAGVFAGAVMHVPATTVELAATQVRLLNADCSVSIGGGSTTGLGKALSLQLKLPQIAIPTTYAGSEMTNIWGITANGGKQTGRDRSVVPVMTIYDPELTLSMPASLAASSGLNALAQAVATVLSPRTNPMTIALALEAVRLLFHGLPQVLQAPQDLAVRSEVLSGASLAGAALGTGATGLHHRLCHVLGGTFDTPHAQTHAILLPHTVAHDAPGAAQGVGRLREVMRVDDPAQALFALGRRLGTPAGLREIGLRIADLDRVIELATAAPIEGPVAVTRESLRRLLEGAFDGAAAPWHVST